MTGGVRLPRRSLLATALAAAVPAHAQDAGVVIPLAAGSFSAVRVAPAGGGAAPTVLVAADNPVADSAIRTVCEKLAAAGYLALAPDLGTLADDAALARLEAAGGWAATNGGVADRLFMTGFGNGGRLAWLFAARATGLRAAVGWGSTAGAAKAAGAMDVAGSLRAPVLGLFGTGDAAHPRSALLELERKGNSSHHAVEIVAYSGAGANFALPGQPGYDEAAALDGWNRMMGWFRRFGGK